MTKPKLFPDRPDKNDEPDPHKRFEDFASKVVAVPKSEVDKREQEWKRRKHDE